MIEYRCDHCAQPAGSSPTQLEVTDDRPRSVNDLYGVFHICDPCIAELRTFLNEQPRW